MQLLGTQGVEDINKKKEGSVDEANIGCSNILGLVPENGTRFFVKKGGRKTTAHKIKLKA